MINDIKNTILSEYKYSTELHAHTLPISRCSEFYAEELINIYAGLGVDTVVLTNHFTPTHLEEKTKDQLVSEYTEAYRDLKKCAEIRGMTAIFSMELRFTENSNDYLIYGITEEDVSEIYEYVDKGIECFYKNFKRDGVLVIQAHPKRKNMTDIDISFIDGMETFNMHPGHNSRVAITSALANKAGLLVTGGTDFHHPGHEGCCIMLTKTKQETPADIVKTIESRDFALNIGGSIVLP